MAHKQTQSRWRTNWLKPGLLGSKQALRPADISDGLGRSMLAPANLLEDANYNKVVPNHFIVEVSQASYGYHYAPLGASLIQQWRDRLTGDLLTANSRLGRKEYRLGGQLQIELRPAPDLPDNQARIHCRVEPDLDSAEGRLLLKSPEPRKEAASLELIDGSRRWPLFPGENIIGRDETCDVFLDLPLVQEKRLVSAQHARIRIAGGQSLLYDGGPSGKASANGTFINSQRVSVQGAPLQDGDIVILAAINPQAARWDTPGVAAFRFRKPPLPA